MPNKTSSSQETIRKKPNINIYTSDNILHWKLDQNISRDYFISVIEEIANIKNDSTQFNILVTESKKELSIDLDTNIKKSKILNLLKIKISDFDSIKCASVVNNPRLVAFFTLVAYELRYSNLELKVFSEVSNAKLWLEQ